MEAGEDPVGFQLFNEIGIIEQLARSGFERVLPEGLSMAGFTVLNHFVRLAEPATTPSGLARAFQVTKGAMTNTLQRLEALGYVTLQTDPADGRGKRVAITPAGRAARGEALDRLSPLLGRVAAGYPAEDAAALLPLLRRLRSLLDAMRAG